MGFASAEDSKTAMAKNRMTLGSRYIELFTSSLDELNGGNFKGMVTYFLAFYMLLSSNDVFIHC